MSISTAIGDSILSKVEGNVVDEYQESMVHKSSTVALSLVPVFAYLLGAILAWAIPGPRAYLSILVMLPIVGPELIGSNWLKAHAPRPGFNRKQLHWTQGVVTMVLAFIMIAGMAYNAADGEWEPLILGGIVGAVAAIIFLPFSLNRRKKKDEERLNAQYED